MISVALLWAFGLGVIFGADEVRKVPFELRSGLVIVQAAINGDSGSFVFDTGFPHTVVNPKKVENLKRLPHVAMGATLKGLPVEVGHFTWAGIERRNLAAVAMDVRTLERTSATELMGVIGLDVLEQHEVLFDMANQVLMLYDADEDWLHLQRTPVHEFRFRLKAGLPVIKAKVGKKRLSIGVDVGGSRNLMSEEMLTAFSAAHLGERSRKWMRGLNQEEAYMTIAPVCGLQLDKSAFEGVTFVFGDLGRADSFGIQGLLGLPFLGKYRFSINYKAKRIYLWPHAAEANYRRI